MVHWQLFEISGQVAVTVGDMKGIHALLMTAIWSAEIRFRFKIREPNHTWKFRFKIFRSMLKRLLGVFKLSLQTCFDPAKACLPNDFVLQLQFY